MKISIVNVPNIKSNTKQLYYVETWFWWLLKTMFLVNDLKIVSVNKMSIQCWRLHFSLCITPILAVAIPFTRLFKASKYSAHFGEGVILPCVPLPTLFSAQSESRAWRSCRLQFVLMPHVPRVFYHLHLEIYPGEAGHTRNIPSRLVCQKSHNCWIVLLLSILQSIYAKIKFIRMSGKILESSILLM